MHLPSPTFEFSIPSVYDGSQLDCRVYLPRDLGEEGNAASYKRGAIVAHPYAPLGGCYDDPVVGFVGGELLKAGYIVGTFNFRGAGTSEGKTSWTAKPELADYVSFYGFMLHYLHGLKLESSSTGESQSTQAETDKSGVHLILGGYSYGSLVASHLPTIDVILDLFRDPSDRNLQEISKIAEKIAACSTEKLQARVRSPTLDVGSNNDGIGPTQILKSTISYLLVSPLLPPISSFLTIFSKLSFHVEVETSAQGKHISCPKPTEQLCAHRSLAIYGSEDIFTPASKLQKWSDELYRDPRGNFHSRGIDSAGHFWREDGVETQAREVLREWLGQMP